MKKNIASWWSRASIIAVVCIACMMTSCSSDDNTAVSPTDDSSQFVNLTDAVPDAILNKPGKLTDEEFAVMKSHTVVGGKILASLIESVPDSDYLYEACNLATYHHEKWNGKGYPTGLSGENIPLSARVMAVADVFDALVSNRSYKKGFPYEKALGIMHEETGTHFDPGVMKAFFAVQDKILEVADKFSEMEKQEKQSE